MRNIVLVGFMGTGKTAAGRKLAKILDMRYVNTDDLIETKEGRAINEIFAKDGEGYFRKVERGIIKEVSDSENSVIATGGGVVLNSENIENLKKNGILICLNSTAEEILERTKNCTHRPLLNVPSPVETIKKLLEKRKPYYAKADYTIDTAGKTIKEIVNEIIEITKKTS